MAHTTLTITDEDGLNPRTYMITYIHLVERHLELEAHLRFKEEWDEISEIFDEHGNVCVVDKEEWQLIANAFYNQPSKLRES